MGYLKDERPQTMMVNGSWSVGAYKYKAPWLMHEFCQGLKEKKLIGSLCPGCGKVIVLPRNLCGRCHVRMSERRVISDWGTITCFIISPPVVKGKFSIFGVDPVQLGILKEGEVIVPVFVRFDGSDSNVNTLLYNCDPEKVHVGMRVKAVWAKTPQGFMSDLEGVEPLTDKEKSGSGPIKIK
jgi:uncharacterized OB-fold protein